METKFEELQKCKTFQEIVSQPYEIEEVGIKGFADMIDGEIMVRTFIKYHNPAVCEGCTPTICCKRGFMATTNEWKDCNYLTIIGPGSRSLKVGEFEQYERIKKQNL